MGEAVLKIDSFSTKPVDFILLRLGRGREGERERVREGKTTEESG